MRKILLRMNRARNLNKEHGFEIAEALVASVVIMIVLVSTAFGLSSSFRSSASVENHNKAVQLANEVIAISKQSSYRKLYVATQPVTSDLFGPGKCDPQTTVPAGTTQVLTGQDNTPFPGLTYCVAKKFGGNTGIGSTFYVQTQIAYLKTASSYDASTNSDSFVSNGAYYAKRVYVTIRWQDVAAGTGSWSSYVASFTASPSPSDCVPDRITQSAAPAPGCAP